MPRRSSDLASWSALTVEGGLISPAQLARIADIDAPMPEATSLAFRIGQSHCRRAFRRAAASAATRLLLPAIFAPTDPAQEAA